MASRFLTDPTANGVGYPVIAANSVALSVADAVYINTSGFMDVASTSSKVLGFSLDTITAVAGDNQTVAKVCPKYCYPDGVTIVITGDSACTQTKVGEYADLVTTTTGAQVLNGTVGATGQFFVIGFDPNADGTTTDYVVMVAEPQQSGYAQS